MMEVLLAVAAVMGVLTMTGLRAMADAEVQERLDRLPFAVLRLARRRVPAELRITLYDREWRPELESIRDRFKATPITWLIVGTKFALGLLLHARQISRLRAGLVGRAITLRRLSSTNTAAIAFGNITTATIGYAFAGIIGFTASDGLITVLGIVNRGMWLPLTIFLDVIFGSAMTALLALSMGPGLRATVHRQFVTVQYAATPQSHDPSQQHGRIIRTLEAFGHFMRGESAGERAPAIVAFATCLSATTLALFNNAPLLKTIHPALIAVLFICTLTFLRMLLMGISLWCEHQRAKITRSGNPEEERRVT